MLPVFSFKYFPFFPFKCCLFSPFRYHSFFPFNRFLFSTFRYHPFFPLKCCLFSPFICCLFSHLDICFPPSIVARSPVPIFPALAYGREFDCMSIFNRLNIVPFSRSNIVSFCRLNIFSISFPYFYLFTV